MNRLSVIAAVARKSAKNAAMIRRAERNAKLSRMVRASLSDDGAADAELWESIESAGYADHGADADE